jgi:hypothetical protein
VQPINATGWKKVENQDFPQPQEREERYDGERIYEAEELRIRDPLRFSRNTKRNAARNA